MNKICGKCKKEKDSGDFNKSSKRKDGLRCYCRECEKSLHRDYFANNEYHRSDDFKKIQKSRKLKYDYGIDIDKFNDMISSQGGLCLCCGIDLRDIPIKDINVDHNHITGNVRGILCRSCNVAFGMLNEDYNRIFMLAQYIIKFCKD